MKKSGYVLLVVASLTFGACKRDVVCECLDERLDGLKTYAEKNYAGEMKSNYPACSSFDLKNKSVSDKFESSAQKCSDYGDWQEENAKWIKHIIDEQKKKTMKMMEELDVEKERLDKLKDQLNME